MRDVGEVYAPGLQEHLSPIFASSSLDKSCPCFIHGTTLKFLTLKKVAKVRQPQYNSGVFYVPIYDSETEYINEALPHPFALYGPRTNDLCPVLRQEPGR